MHGSSLTNLLRSCPGTEHDMVSLRIFYQYFVPNETLLCFHYGTDRPNAIDWHLPFPPTWNPFRNRRQKGRRFGCGVDEPGLMSVLHLQRDGSILRIQHFTHCTQQFVPADGLLHEMQSLVEDGAVCSNVFGITT